MKRVEYYIHGGQPVRLDDLKRDKDYAEDLEQVILNYGGDTSEDSYFFTNVSRTDLFTITGSYDFEVKDGFFIYNKPSGEGKAIYKIVPGNSFSGSATAEETAKIYVLETTDSGGTITFKDSSSQNVWPAKYCYIVGSAESGPGGSVYVGTVGTTTYSGNKKFEVGDLIVNNDINITNDIIPETTNTSKLGSPAIPFNSLYTYNVFNSVEGQDLTIKCLESNSDGGDVVISGGDSVGAPGGNVTIFGGTGDGVNGKILINNDTDITGVLDITGTLISSGLISGSEIYLDSAGSQVTIGGGIMTPTKAYYIKPIDSVAGWDMTILAGGGTTSNDGGDTEIGGGSSISGDGGELFLHGGTSGSGAKGILRMDGEDIIIDNMKTTSSSPYTVYASVFAGNDYYISRGASVSDIKYKENLVKIDSPMDKIKTLNGYYFNWNEKSTEVFDEVDFNETQIGLIAQEVEKVFPDLVGHEVNNGNDFKYVKYDKMMPLIISALNELKKEIEELKNK